MMPSDITGHAVLDPKTMEMRIVRGPVFTHLLLADEINRAPAKTQSALLEVMQEYQVTLEGQTHALPKPFMVLATQNPVETEGTYPLPEAQLDRFLFKIEIGYPSLDDEVGVVIRATTDQAGDQLPLSKVTAVLNERAVTSLQTIAARQRVDEQVIDYAVRLARATREWAGLAHGRRLARRAGAGARRARRGPARRPQLRDSRRHQARRVAGAAPPHRAGARCAARRPQARRPAGRGHRKRGGAARLTRMKLRVIPSSRLLLRWSRRPARPPRWPCSLGVNLRLGRARASAGVRGGAAAGRLRRLRC